MRMKFKCFLVVGHEKRQKTSRIVDVYDDLSIELLQALVTSQTANDWRLFRSSAVTLSRKLKTLCKELGWKSLILIPHSRRYGGATEALFMRNM